MPYALCAVFSEVREYAQLQAQYLDGTNERSQLAQTSWKMFKLVRRLTAARMAAVKAFWGSQQGGVVPFLFYNLAEGAYDPTGNSTQGQHMVVFRGNWSQANGMLRAAGGRVIRWSLGAERRVLQPGTGRDPHGPLNSARAGSLRLRGSGWRR